MIPTHELLEIAKEIEAMRPVKLKRAMEKAMKIEVQRREVMKKSRAKYEAKHQLLLTKARELGLLEDKNDG